MILTQLPSCLGGNRSCHFQLWLLAGGHRCALTEATVHLADRFLWGSTPQASAPALWAVPPHLGFCNWSFEGQARLYLEGGSSQWVRSQALSSPCSASAWQLPEGGKREFVRRCHVIDEALKKDSPGQAMPVCVATSNQASS